MHALENLNFPANQFEVLIIDDGSDPPISAQISNLESRLSIQIFRQNNRGPAAARNLGLQHAKADFVVFTDDDCRPHPQWLTAYKTAFDLTPEIGLGGRIQAAEENRIYGNASQLLISYLYEHPLSGPAFFCSNNVAFPLRKLIGIGGFDEHFPLAAAEDRDLCDRWANLFPLAHLPEASVIHTQNLSFIGFLRQHFRYGRGAFHFQSRRAKRGQSRLNVEPFTFYANLLLYPWKSQKPWTAAATSLLLGLSQLATSIGFFYELKHSRNLSLNQNQT